jgi:hypothetical protein
MSIPASIRVRRLLHEHPEERPLLQAACDQARKCEPGDFAGSWVLEEMAQQTGKPAWRPGLRRLSAFGLIESLLPYARPAGGRAGTRGTSQRITGEPRHVRGSATPILVGELGWFTDASCCR